MKYFHLLNWEADSVSALASSIAALISAVAFFAAWYQIRKINRRNEYDTYNQIKKDIDSEFVYNLIGSIKKSSIEIVSDQCGSDHSKAYITGPDLNSKFLDHIEDLYIFYRKGLIDVDIIDSGFGQKILIVGNNQQVETHINKLRGDYNDNHLYSGFHELYKLMYKRLPAHLKSNFRKDIL